MKWPRWLLGTKEDGAPYEVAGDWGLYRSLLTGYMDRFILRTPLGTLRLHHILSADEEPYPHDHPFSFTSLVLRGGYTHAYRRWRHPWDWKFYEGKRTRTPGLPWYAPEEIRQCRAGQWWSMGGEDVHRILRVMPNTWTLVVSGPKRKSWGFLVNEAIVPWRAYFGLQGATQNVDIVIGNGDILPDPSEPAP